MQHIVVDNKAVFIFVTASFLGSTDTLLFCVPSLQVSFWSPLPGPPARMTGMVGDTHPEITVHFQAWINTEPSTDYVECTGVICFPCLSKTLFRYDGGISMVEDITSTSTTPLKHLVVHNKRCGNTKRDKASWRDSLEYKSVNIKYMLSILRCKTAGMVGTVKLKYNVACQGFGGSTVQHISQGLKD